MFGMQLGIGAKKVSILRGGIGDARIAQHERKDGSEGRPHDEERAEHSPPCPKGALQQRGRNVIARLIRTDLVQFLPRQNTQNADVHDQIKRANNHDRNKDRAGNVALRALDLRAQKAHVVIAPVIVCGQQHGRAQAGDEAGREIKRSGSKRESARRVEVAESSDDHQQDCAEHADGEIARKLSDDRDAAIQQPQREQAASHRDKCAVGNEETEFKRAERPESQ